MDDWKLTNTLLGKGGGKRILVDPSGSAFFHLCAHKRPSIREENTRGVRVPFSKERRTGLKNGFYAFSGTWCRNITYLSYYNKPLPFPGFPRNGEPTADFAFLGS
jgi:hypothetical protein